MRLQSALRRRQVDPPLTPLLLLTHLHLPPNPLSTSLLIDPPLLIQINPPDDFIPSREIQVHQYNDGILALPGFHLTGVDLMSLAINKLEWRMNENMNENSNQNNNQKLNTLTISILTEPRTETPTFLESSFHPIQVILWTKDQQTWYLQCNKTGLSCHFSSSLLNVMKIPFSSPFDLPIAFKTIISIYSIYHLTFQGITSVLLHDPHQWSLLRPHHSTLFPWMRVSVSVPVERLLQLSETQEEVLLDCLDTLNWPLPDDERGEMVCHYAFYEIKESDPLDRLQQVVNLVHSLGYRLYLKCASDFDLESLLRTCQPFANGSEPKWVLEIPFIPKSFQDWSLLSSFIIVIQQEYLSVPNDAHSWSHVMSFVDCTVTCTDGSMFALRQHCLTRGWSHQQVECLFRVAHQLTDATLKRGLLQPSYRADIVLCDNEIIQVMTGGIWMT